MAEIIDFPFIFSELQAKQKLPLEANARLAPLVDSSTRAKALDPRRSFIVEAPAGSGKTGLLVQRFLNLLGNSGIGSPEEILAITFTRKATAELRERILTQLEAAVAKLPLPHPDSAFERQTRELAEAVLARDRERNWNLLNNPRRLRIQTIDSLCMEIAGTLPLLSGSAARRPVDDASELHREAARNTLRQLGNTKTPEAQALHEALHTVLLHRDANLADVQNLLAEMLQTREQWAELVPLDRASLSEEALDEQVRPRLERTLERIVCSGLNQALRIVPPAALAELADIAHHYSGEPDYKDRPLPIRICSDHPGPPAAEAAYLDHWRALISLLLTKDCQWRKRLSVSDLQFKPSKYHEERLKQILADIQCDPLREALEAIRRLPPAKYPDDQWSHAKALFRLLLHALAELRLLFAETGECDFTEFSLAAREALAGHADDFAAGVGAPLRHLLVDEMQDTSSAQYGLLTSLTRTWDGSSQTLFLVGDPKQSIYLFRQARVERFLRTMQDGALGDVPLEPLQLTANFRSRPAVVESINQASELLFALPGQPLSADTVDVPFVAAVPTRSPHSHTGVHWHTRVVENAGRSIAEVQQRGGGKASEAGGSHGLQATEGGPSDVRALTPGLSLAAATEPTPAQQDAHAIRAIVESWRSTPLPLGRTEPWRIAVLAAARSHLAPIATELALASIPYRAVKVEPLADRPEVLDALALTRALAHPADRAAWFAVLRAPWCGLSAADLLALVAEGDPSHTKSTIPHLVAVHRDRLSNAGSQLLHRIWPILQAALENASRIALPESVERTWKSLGGNSFLTADQRSNVDRFFALLRDSVRESRIDLAGLNRRLKDLYAEPSSAPGAVELMTVHGAKGLEWDVVIVPELGRPGQRERSRLLNWLELESGPEPAVLLAPIQGKGDNPSDLYKWLSRVYARRLEAERKRQFYVACTRAREELHLFATAKHGKQGLVTASGSLLHACWSAAEPHFANAAAAVLPFPQPEIHKPEALLALAAAADPAPNPYLPRLTRLPLSFDPRQRFREAAEHRLPYVPASQLPRQQALFRPEGSLAVRALGNVVHRFLEKLASRLAGQPLPLTVTDRPIISLRDELPTWLDRLQTSLRAEGLAPAEAGREASRALTLLANTLADPVGLWLLSPHAEASSERALATANGLLRVDRTFHAGRNTLDPLSSTGATTWVVDFKTTAPGGRNPEQFLAAQRETYGPQLSRYAEALHQPGAATSIRLGLYFPAIPRFIHWSSENGERTAENALP